MLVLERGGRADASELEQALACGSRHVSSLAEELVKELIHAGYQALGSHDPLFELARAAEALLELPAERQTPYERPALVGLRVPGRAVLAGLLRDEYRPLRWDASGHASGHVAR